MYMHVVCTALLNPRKGRLRSFRDDDDDDDDDDIKIIRLIRPNCSTVASEW